VSLPDEPLWLHADATRLEQIVVNLLDNAAKYTDEGGRIEFSVWSGNGQAVLRVVDNGIGIERELLPRIFDLFTQSERSLDRSGGGLGIGLSLVQRLVQMHGGTGAVDSVVGRGSEFTVHLPLAAQPTQVAARPGVSRSSPLRALRVLVVDDNVDAAQSFGLLLEASGHDVRLAYDGDEALVAADEHRPEVIFLDIGLPKRDGYEVARRLRSQAAHRDVLLAAMTGYGQSSDRERSQAAGFDHHLVKPADFACVEPILASVASHGPAGGRKAKAEARVESVGGTVRSQETARDTAGRPAPAA
jgi:CheY-like chemotaxis protein